jgi:hypothetical protein
MLPINSPDVENRFPTPPVSTPAEYLLNSGSASRMGIASQLTHYFQIAINLLISN